MKRDILGQLERASPMIRGRWESLLRSDSVSSPLSNPDKMATLIPDSLAEIIRALHGPFSDALARRGARQRRDADCGHNPYRAYFHAGEQAMTEAVVLAQTACHADTADENDVAEVVGVIRAAANPQIDAFCSVCRKYGLVSRCQFAARAVASR